MRYEELEWNVKMGENCDCCSVMYSRIMNDSAGLKDEKRSELGVWSSETMRIT